MYSISRQSARYGVFYVTDSCDGKEEQFTREEIKQFIDNGVTIYGYEDEVKRQEKIKGDIDKLKSEHGADKVHSDFVDAKVEKKENHLDEKQDILEEVRKNTEYRYNKGDIKNVTELTNIIRGNLLRAKMQKKLTDEDVRVASMQLQTEFVKRHPELVQAEADFVAQQKQKKAKLAQNQMKQMQNVANSLQSGSDLDYTLYVFTVVGVVMDDDTVLAYNIVSNLSDSVMFLKVDLLRQVYATTKQKVQFTNAIYDQQTGLLKTPKGLALESIYPKIEPDFSLRNVNGLTITSLILDNETDAVLGAVCFDGFGVRYNYTLQSIMSYVVKGNLNCNFKIKTGVILPKHCLDNFEFPKVHMSIPKPEAIYSSAFGEEKPYVIVEDTDCAPVITQRVYDFDELNDNAFMKSGEEKYQWACLSLKKVAPYYYTMFQAIKKIPVVGFGTLGVTEDTMIIDYQFVSQCSIAELTYIFIHEMNHIAMQHSIREGRRNHSLWNIACDLYINSIINRDYDCHPGGGVSEITLENDPDNPDKKKVVIQHYDGTKGDTSEDYVKNTQSGYIKCPTYGVFLDSIGESIDLAKDTVERIYERLLAENPNFEDEENNASNNVGDNSNSSGSSSNATNNQNQNNNNNKSTNGNVQEPQVTPEMVNEIQRAIAQIQEGAKEGLETCRHSQASENANNEIQSGIQTVQEGIKNKDFSQIQKGFDNINQGISDMQSAMNQAQVNDGVKEMKEGIAQAKDICGDNSIDSASRKIQTGIDTLKNGLNTNDNKQVQNGLNKVQDGVSDMLDKLSEKDSWQRKEMQDAVSSINQGVQDMKNAVQVDQLQEGIRELKQGTRQGLQITNKDLNAQQASVVISDALAKMQEGYETDNKDLIEQGLNIADNGTRLMADAMRSYQEEVRNNTIKDSLKVCEDLAIENKKAEKVESVKEAIVASMTNSDRRAYESGVQSIKKLMGKGAKSDRGQVALINLDRVFEEMLEDSEEA